MECMRICTHRLQTKHSWVHAPSFVASSIEPSDPHLSRQQPLDLEISTVDKDFILQPSTSYCVKQNPDDKTQKHRTAAPAARCAVLPQSSRQSRRRRAVIASAELEILNLRCAPCAHFEHFLSFRTRQDSKPSWQRPWHLRSAVLQCWRRRLLGVFWRVRVERGPAKQLGRQWRCVRRTIRGERMVP